MPAQRTDQARLADPEIWGSSKACVRHPEGQDLGGLYQPASTGGLKLDVVHEVVTSRMIGNYQTRMC